MREEREREREEDEEVKRRKRRMEEKKKLFFWGGAGLVRGGVDGVRSMYGVVLLLVSSAPFRCVDTP